MKTTFIPFIFIIFNLTNIYGQSDVTVKPLGFSINTEFSESHPLLTADGKTLYFTSKRPLLPAEQKRNVESRANIYRSLFNDDGQAWGEATPLPEYINDSESENTAFALSNDGQLILFHRKDSIGTNAIYSSKLIGNSWSEPQKLSEFGLNEAYLSGSIASDNKTFYFIGKSEMIEEDSDIWVGKISDKGSVYDISRVKDVINSADAVASVFIHPDGRTLLYSQSTFSDNFDIFYSQLDSTKWKSPLRISAPINSSSFERNFTAASNAKFAIFSSDRNEGQFDLFTANLSESALSQPKLTLLNGLVKDSENGQPIGASINVSLLTSQSSFGTFNSNNASGKYLISLPSSGKNYALTILSENYLLHSENILCSNSYTELDKTISLQKIKIGNNALLNNIHFLERESKILPESAIEINQLYLFLKQNPTIKIELSVFSLVQNSKILDKQLSIKRAVELKNQLERLGINKKRIKLFKFSKHAKIEGLEGIIYTIVKI